MKAQIVSAYPDAHGIPTSDGISDNYGNWA